MKTAVEWLEDKLNGVDTGVSNHYFKEIIEQANEMFEQQIVSSYRDGRSDQQSNNSIWFNRKAKQYYNETFK